MPVLALDGAGSWRLPAVTGAGGCLRKSRTLPPDRPRPDGQRGRLAPSDPHRAPAWPPWPQAGGPDAGLGLTVADGLAVVHVWSGPKLARPSHADEGGG